MARIRAIKPEFWSSPSLPANPWARLLFIALWNWADDNGVGTATPRELLGFAFPNDEHLTLADLRRMLVEITRALDVKFYTVAGRPYYAIGSWEKHQKFDRRSKGKYPGPDQAETWLYQDGCDDSMDTRGNYTSPRRDSVAGTGEQGNRGTGEPGNSRVSYSGTDREQKRETPSEQGCVVETVLIPIPDDWAPNDLHRAKYPRPDLDELAASFRDHAISVGRTCNGHAGWDAAFGNWVRKSPAPAIPGMGAGSTKAQGWLNLISNLPPDPDNPEQRAIGQ